MNVTILNINKILAKFMSRSSMFFGLLTNVNALVLFVEFFISLFGHHRYSKTTKWSKNEFENINTFIYRTS